MIAFARRSIVAAASATLFATAAWAAPAAAAHAGAATSSVPAARATPATGWERSKYTLSHRVRRAHSTSTLEVYDAQSMLRERFDYHVASDQTGAGGWPVMMARIVNARSKLLRIGALQGEDIVPVPTPGANRLYLQPGVTFQYRSWTPEPGYVAAGDFDYPYPDGRGRYVPGLTVVRGDDGARYGCRPFPAGAWCNVAHDDYRPGIGNAWQEAWVSMEAS